MPLLFFIYRLLINVVMCVIWCTSHHFLWSCILFHWLSYLREDGVRILFKVANAAVKDVGTVASSTALWCFLQTQYNTCTCASWMTKFAYMMHHMMMQSILTLPHSMSALYYIFGSHVKVLSYTTYIYTTGQSVKMTKPITWCNFRSLSCKCRRHHYSYKIASWHYNITVIWLKMRVIVSR